MTPVARALLLRIARRTEERAEGDYKVAQISLTDPKALDTAKRRRDRELGDAKDLREYVKCQDAEQGAKVEQP